MHAWTLLIAPLAVLAATLVCWRGPGLRPRASVRLAEMFALLAIAGAVVSALLLVARGPATAGLIGPGGLGLAVRLDVVSVVMLLLVSFIGWVVIRYAATYLDGETRQGRFMALIAGTLAAVMLLVTAGNLLQLVVAWILTGAGIHQLLLFYPDRVQAQRAARKMAWCARAGDVALVSAAVALWWITGTGDTTAIAAKAAASGASLTVPALLLVVAALLKSAQFPAHGWLTEVMEAPTPVSALLHAGVINAGGFLLIRFADVMVASPAALAILVTIGGFTALFAGLVMLTQTAVKTSLAWSTIGQMGFMILQCGLALFPLALLHIVAHSFYKAHAFLGSGDAVAQVSAVRAPGPVAAPSPAAVGRAFLLALVIYGAVGVLFGYQDKPPQAVALGAILIFGVAYLIAQGLADAAPRALTLRTGLASLAAAAGYFALQTGAEWLMAGTLPATPAPGPLEWALVILTVASFGLVAVAQALFPLWAYHPATAGLRVHLTNGLYVNAMFDRWLHGWALKQS